MNFYTEEIPPEEEAFLIPAFKNILKGIGKFILNNLPPDFWRKHITIITVTGAILVLLVLGIVLICRLIKNKRA